ncbi:MAG TPA: hypothetical protein VFS14_02995 [Candidatus Saccharimonadales bacterium]|nr:hypothetical protein [Candidatus Saccharimonadales bacterium]
MPAKKTPQKTKRPADTAAKKSRFGRVNRAVSAAKARTRSLLSRRPHRSFRRTLKRDYTRSLKLPGYWAFTNIVRKTMWQNRKVFGWMIVVYAIFTVGLVGLASQDTYIELSETLRETSGEVFKGNWGELGKAGLLLVSGATGELNMTLTEAQQIYAVIVIFFTWLTTVWLLRAILAGKKPRLRDGLYNAGAPVLPTLLLGGLLIVQLLPAVAVVLGYVALSPYGILEGGVESMIFSAAALLLIILSLYWITSTLIAMVVITLPGQYPMQAIRAAGDLVVGRRLRILLRLLWLALIVVLTWAIVMIPIILFDAWLKGVFPAINWLPLVPIALLVLGTVTVVWAAGYIYLLYRRIVNDDAAPA